MEQVLDVAKYIVSEYQKVSGEIIDAMKLQKLLYYTLRESIAVAGEPMFDAIFEGWKYGPVCKMVWDAYAENKLSNLHKPLSFDSKYIVNSIIHQYGVIESWELSNMSHREVSWKNARIGLDKNENGTKPLSLSDIEFDAKKIRPYDHLWDMYYDEFDTVECSAQ